MREIVYTDEFGGWFEELEPRQQEAVIQVVERLNVEWLGLGYPHSSDIKGTKAPLRELRAQDADHPIRVMYAFDPARDAVLLIGGNKKGDDRFYEWIVPFAEKIWNEYVAENFSKKKQT